MNKQCKRIIIYFILAISVLTMSRFVYQKMLKYGGPIDITIHCYDDGTESIDLSDPYGLEIISERGFSRTELGFMIAGKDPNKTGAKYINLVIDIEDKSAIAFIDSIRDVNVHFIFEDVDGKTIDMDILHTGRSYGRSHANGAKVVQ